MLCRKLYKKKESAILLKLPSVDTKTNDHFKLSNRKFFKESEEIEMPNAYFKLDLSKDVTGIR